MEEVRLVNHSAGVRIQHHFVPDDPDMEYRGWREIQNIGRRIGPLTLKASCDGELLCNGIKAICYRSPIQFWGNPIVARSLRHEIRTKRSLTFPVLVYLIRHQELIPASWRRAPVFFWGSAVAHADGKYVGSLKWVRDLSSAGGSWWAQFSPWDQRRESWDSAVILL